MAKANDNGLSFDDLRVIERRARRLLDRADAWNRFPVPIGEILAAANVRVAPTNAFDPATILAYIRDKAVSASARIKSALAKVLGIYDAGEKIIHIDNSVVKAKQTFLKLHETAHHDLPTHRKLFRFFQDCEKTLAPEIADKFEREANNFARFVLFKGDVFSRQAADSALDIKTPIKLAKKFGASLYASAREFARTSHRACAVYVLEPLEFVEGDGARAVVRRIEASPAFITQFGQPADTAVTPDHFLWPMIPIKCKMVRPVSLSITDKNGEAHECVAEAFDTTYNVLILLYPEKALTSKTITLSPRSRAG